MQGIEGRGYQEKGGGTPPPCVSLASVGTLCPGNLSLSSFRCYRRSFFCLLRNKSQRACASPVLPDPSWRRPHCVVVEDSNRSDFKMKEILSLGTMWNELEGC